MTAADGAPTPEEIDAFMRATVRSQQMTDEAFSMLEERIMDVEEIVHAGWPRRVFLARRLRRKLRASIQPFPGDSFATRRVHAVSTEMAVRERHGGGRS
jgi:hypothetical protein